MPSSPSTATARPTAPPASGCSTPADALPLTGLLSTAISVVETFADDDRPDLYRGERALVAGAVQRRVAEFATARRCARDALTAFGERVPILAGPDREPLWPAGVVGSITHCAGYRAAAVAPVSAGLALGIDAEPNLPLPDGVLAVVTRPAERQAVAARQAAMPSIAWDRLVFSAKESVYKAWFPLTGTWLGFEDAELTIGSGTFSATIDAAPSRGPAGSVPRIMTGRWTLDVRRQLLLTCVERWE